MSARKAGTKPAVPAPPPAPIRLEDLRITWTRPAHFVGESERTAVTITGAQLATLLGWIAQTRPSLNLEGFADVSLELEGLGETLDAISNADLSGLEPGPIFWVLGRYAQDLAARVSAVEEAPLLLKDATVRVEAAE